MPGYMDLAGVLMPYCLLCKNVLLVSHFPELCLLSLFCVLVFALYFILFGIIIVLSMYFSSIYMLSSSSPFLSFFFSLFFFFTHQLRTLVEDQGLISTPTCDSQQSVTPVLGYLIRSFVPFGTRHKCEADTYMQAKHPCRYKVSI